MSLATLKEALDIFDVLLVPLISYAVWILSDVRNQMRLLNGRMIKLEQWRQNHEEWEEDKFAASSEAQREVRADLKAIQERCIAWIGQHGQRHE